jgi:hypothetical protein
MSAPATTTSIGPARIGIDAGGVLYHKINGSDQTDRARQPIAGAAECLKRMIAAGHSLYLISFAGRKTAAITLTDVREHFPDTFIGIFIVKDKLEKVAICHHLGIDVMIDDSLEVHSSISNGMYLGKARAIAAIPTIRRVLFTADMGVEELAACATEVRAMNFNSGEEVLCARRVWSFKNGRYFGDDNGMFDVFVPYSQSAAFEHIASANYFDINFNSGEEVGFDWFKKNDGDIIVQNEVEPITPEDLHTKCKQHSIQGLVGALSDIVVCNTWDAVWANCRGALHTHVPRPEYDIKRYVYPEFCSNKEEETEPAVTKSATTPPFTPATSSTFHGTGMDLGTSSTAAPTTLPASSSSFLTTAPITAPATSSIAQGSVIALGTPPTVAPTTPSASSSSSLGTDAPVETSDVWRSVKELLLMAGAHPACDPEQLKGLRTTYLKQSLAQLAIDRALLDADPNAPISSCALHFPRSGSRLDVCLGGFHREAAQLLFPTTTDEAAAAVELRGEALEKKLKALRIWSQIRLSRLVSTLSAHVRRQQEQARVEELSRKHAAAIHAVDPSGLKWCLLKNRPVSDEVKNPLPMPIAPLPQDQASFRRCLEFLRKHRDGIQWTDVGTEIDGFPVQFDEVTKVRFLDLEHFAVYDDRRFDGCKRGYTPGVVDRLFDALQGNTYFEHFLFGNNCFAEDTLVSLPNGTSIPIQDVKPGDFVLSFDEHTANGVKYSGASIHGRMVSAVHDNGRKECIELLLEDGRIITCTADHKFRTKGGDWVEAGNLSSTLDSHRVSVTAEYPMDVECSLEEVWSLHLETASTFRKKKQDLDLSMSTPENRDRTLAFARLCGFNMSDGNVTVRTRNVKHSESFTGNMSLGHQDDVASVIRDIRRVTGVEPSFTLPTTENSVFAIALPARLCEWMVSAGVPAGDKTTSVASFPEFVTSPSCPLAVVREFLGGMFGGDGAAPSYGHEGKFTTLRFAQCKTGDVVRSSQSVWDTKLRSMFARFNVLMSGVITTQLHVSGTSAAADSKRRRLKAEGLKLSERITLETHSVDQKATYQLLITFSDAGTLAFAEKIGFRFCCHKQTRLSAACSFWRSVDRCDAQRSRLRELILQKWQPSKWKLGKLKLVDVLSSSKAELQAIEAVHPHTLDWKPDGLDDLNKGVRFGPSSSKEALETWGLSAMFSDKRTGTKYAAAQANALARTKRKALADDYDDVSAEPVGKVRWAVHRDSHVLPMFYLRVVNQRSVGLKHVYDLTVPVQSGSETASLQPSFVANGCLVHNCSGSKGCSGLAYKLLPPGHRYLTLYLAGMNLTEEADWALLARTLRDDTRVQALWLKRNKVGAAGAKALVEYLRTNRTLRILDLDETALGDEGFTTICDALAENGTVRHLYARGNGLGPASGAALAKCLRIRAEKHLPGLRSVFLGSNRLGDEGVAAIAGALPHATDLRRLILSSNRIEAVGMRALAAAPMLESLEVVDLGIEVTTADLGELPNRIADEGLDAVLEFLQKQRHLRSIALAHNRFSREALGKLYTACGKEHPHLLHVDIGERGFKRDTAAWNRLVKELTLKIVNTHGVMTYQEFLTGGRLAALRNIRETRNIESIYRTADFRGANRKKLVKRWPNGRVEFPEADVTAASIAFHSTGLGSSSSSSTVPAGVAAAQHLCNELTKQALGVAPVTPASAVPSEEVASQQ